MWRGSGCLGCIFQRANRYRLLFSPSKLFVHTDKQGEKRDVRSRGRRRRRVSDMRVIYLSFLSFLLPRLSLLSSLDSLPGLRVKRKGGRGRKIQKEGGEEKKEKRGKQESERQEKSHWRQESKRKQNVQKAVEDRQHKSGNVTKMSPSRCIIRDMRVEGDVVDEDCKWGQTKGRYRWMRVYSGSDSCCLCSNVSISRI